MMTSVVAWIHLMTVAVAPSLKKLVRIDFIYRIMDFDAAFSQRMPLDEL